MQALVDRYQHHRSEYTSRRSLYSETDVREDFINPFFELLGWDVRNERNLSRQFREVVRETRAIVNEQTKRPDYEFKLGPERKFYVEAKKPNADIINSSDPAFQVRRYGWSANLKISILTNFEYLVIYDTTTQPSLTDAPAHSRLYRFHYTEYAEKFEEIKRLISREAIYSGQFDEYFSAHTVNRREEAVDLFFLERLNQWRLSLATDIITDRPNTDQQTVNEIVERFILRILFLRMCEDRGIQTYQQLQQIAATNDWRRFIAFLTEVDQRFDSGLFATRHDPLCNLGGRQIRLNGTTIREIMDSLYFPQAPYTFAVFEPEFLGYVYEQFLRERIDISAQTAILRPKPENEGRDIVPTPPPLINRIVRDTLPSIFEGLSFEQILEKKIIDPACGSGGFLISAFNQLVEIATAIFEAHNNQTTIFQTTGGWQLTFQKKCELLQNCIYGVDRDYSAVEVTRFSLLVKLLEDESVASLPSGEAILPSLDDNIVHGDALVDNRIYAYDHNPDLVGVPLNWGEDIPARFDGIIGNPPYLKTEDIKNLEPVEYNFYKRPGHYQTAYQQFDKYYLFLERIVNSLLKADGQCGMVVSRKFSHIESGKKIRDVLSREAFLIRMVDFGNAQLFEGRTTYTCLLYFSKVRPENLQETPLVYENINTPQDWLQQYRQTQPGMPIPRRYVSGENAWILPSSRAELDLFQAMSHNTILLGEVADVFNGIQTSRNSVYVITDWQDEGTNTLSFIQDGRHWPLEKSILKPFYDGSVAELKSFFPLPHTAYVIFPYQIERDGHPPKASVIPPAVMQSDYPLAYAWLNDHRQDLERRDISPKPYPPEEWYRYGRQQALTAFENRLKIVVGVNCLGDKYVYDETNTLLASGGTAGECAVAAFQEDPEKSPYDLLFIHALLNHKAVEFFCRKRGSPFRGGWFPRGTAVLKEVPIPRIETTTENSRHQLYRDIIRANQNLHSICRELNTTTSQAGHNRLERQQRAIKNELAVMINRLYGIEAIIGQVELPR